MTRKKVEGPVRNKAKSKQKLLDAVGTILSTKGYSAIKVNEIAKVAGLDKKLIYNYFGNCDNLIDEYIRSKDFWSNANNEGVLPEISDAGLDFSKSMLLSQFDYMSSDEEFRKIILWRLSEERSSLTKLTDDQEKVGESLLQTIMDPHFKENAQRYRAVMAILISGVYYLNLYSQVNGSVFCGLDIKTDEGKASIKNALSFLVDQTYKGL